MPVPSASTFQETVTAYAQNRAVSAPLPTGNAPFTSSTSFKLRPQAHAPRARDWTQHLSAQGRNSTASTLKIVSKNATEANLLSLGTARPAAEFYPWESLTMSCARLGLTKSLTCGQKFSASCSKNDDGLDLGIAMNYGYSAGCPQLVRFITEHVEMIHSPPYQDWESCLTCSTTSAIDILLRILCDRGDWVVMEQYTYPGTVEAAKNMGLRILSIAMDDQGILPTDLDQKLCHWDPKSKKPSVLYTIPSGQNPTGVTQSAVRRREVYKIAEKHDLLVIEDDPYCFIQLGRRSDPEDSQGSSLNPEQYLQHLPPSYLSMDTSGRVLRLDSTSKILAPGLRCGWMTGCKQLVAKFLSVTDLCAVAPSGPSQVMLSKLLDEGWGHEGLITWLDDLSSRYRRRLQIMTTACGRFFPINVCEWSIPKHGMFLWIQVDWSRHPVVLTECSSPSQNATTTVDVEDSIYQACIKCGVQVSKGSWFLATQAIPDKVFFRITFAATDETHLEVAIARFGSVLCEEFRTLGNQQLDQAGLPLEKGSRVASGKNWMLHQGRPEVDLEIPILTC